MADLVKQAVEHVLEPLKAPELSWSEGEDGPLRFDFGQLERLEAGILGYYDAEGEELLGCYHSMSSPGRITLFGDNLRSFYWALIHRMTRAGHHFWKVDLEPLAHLTVLKTWTHEQFHLFVDIQERLAPGRPTAGRLMEEALACAHSWQQVHLLRSKGPLSRIRQNLLRPFLDMAYAYRKPGYSEWALYASETNFQTGLLRFFDRSEFSFLEASGVPVAKLLLSQLSVVLETVTTDNQLN